MDSMRRTPVQQRSTARVERMLDVCGELIDTHLRVRGALHDPAAQHQG
ncbi:MAG: hypothetical protein HY241_07690 [Actinobacteria bacterium]|nr:hypothetical protein [Actinomycetota bacterium]